MHLLLGPNKRLFFIKHVAIESWEYQYQVQLDSVQADRYQPRTSGDRLK